jgi:hypothetical protein
VEVEAVAGVTKHEIWLATTVITFFCLPWFLTAELTGVLPASVGLTLVVLLAGKIVASPHSKVIISTREKFFYAAIFLSVVLSASLSGIAFPGRVDLRVVTSVFILVANLAFAVVLFSSVINNGAVRAARIMFFVSVLIGVLSFAAPINFGVYSTLRKPVFPFYEPSHYALFYTQVLALIVATQSRKYIFASILITLLFALLIPNTLLLLSALMAASLVLSLRALLLVVPFGGIAAAVFFGNIDYFTDRIGGDSLNGTYLVWLQGLESMYISIAETYGLGVGFQNLGVQEPGPISLLIYQIYGDYLNRNDGGFVIAKLTGELGVFGLMLSSYLLWLAVRCGFVLRRQFKSFEDLGVSSIPLCAIFFAIPELMVRGVGYFSPTFIWFIFMIPSCMVAIKKYSVFGRHLARLTRHRHRHSSVEGS